MGGIKIQLHCHMGSPKAADRLWNRVYWSALYRRIHNSLYTLPNSQSVNGGLRLGWHFLPDQFKIHFREKEREYRRLSYLHNMISLKYLQENNRIMLRVYIVLEMILIIQKNWNWYVKDCLCVHVYQCVFRGPSSCQLLWYSTHSTTIKSTEYIRCLWVLEFI